MDPGFRAFELWQLWRCEAVFFDYGLKQHPCASLNNFSSLETF